MMFLKYNNKINIRKNEIIKIRVVSYNSCYNFKKFYFMILANFVNMRASISWTLKKYILNLVLHFHLTQRNIFIDIYEKKKKKFKFQIASKGLQIAKIF